MQCALDGVVVQKARKIILDILTDHNSALMVNLPEDSLKDFVAALVEAHLITNAIKKAPSIDKIIEDFKANLAFKTTLAKIKDHCLKLLKAFNTVGGSYSGAASLLGKKWNENELGIDFKLNFED